MNNFEHKIKNRLENYNSEINPYEIWDGIQTKLNKKEKRRWGFIWLAASFFLLTTTVISISYFYNTNNTKEIVKGTNKSHSEVLQKSTIQKKSNENISNNKNNTTTLITENHIITPPTNKIVNKKSNSIWNKNLKEEEHKYKNDSDIIQEELNDQNLHKNSSIHKSSLLEATNKVTTSRLVIIFDKLNNEINDLVYKRQQLNPHFNTTRKNGTSKIFFDKKLYPEISFAANYTYNNFTLNNNDSKLFMQNVNDNEKQLEAFDIFFGYNIPIFKNVGLFAGLNYGQIDSKLDFSYKDRKEVIVDSALTKVVYKSLTDTLRIYERAKTNGYFKIHDVKYNYQRYLRIPLLITYSSNIKSLKYEIRTGVDFNILTCSNARAITFDGKTTPLENTEKNQQKNNILGDFHFDLRINYKLNNNLVLTFGPQYKLSLSSLMQNKAGFDIYRHSYGFNIGTKYKM